MSRETIQKILGKTETGRSADSAARDAGDAADPLEATYIDVTLYAVEKQTKTAVISVKSDLNMTFDEVPVGASVYAKAKIYKYLDAGQTQRDVIYNGESSRIVVHNGQNALNLKLAGAMLTITFNSNGGSSVSSKKVATGTTVEKPADPVKPVKKEKYSRYDNNAFEGWYTDPQLTKGFDFSTTITDDITLYAKWLKDFVFVEGDVVTNYLADGRNVTIGDLFVSDHEVTQAEYKAVTNSNPSQFHFDDEEPVENVTWFDAIKYCNLLSIQEGLTPCYKVNNSTDPANWGTLTPTTQVVCNLSARGYRLPTEAEWEYIATKAERNKPLSSMAMYSANSEGRPQKVKKPLADELYLCDLLGNVAEWCFDVYSTSISASTGKTGPAATGTENSRVVRGGAYNSPASECAKDLRSSANPTIASSSTGFRVVRSAIDEFAIVTNTVTFLTNGGSAVATQYIVEGETVSQPADPTKTGYNFDGWLYNGSVFDFGTIIAQDIVLEAKWTAHTYTVNFDKGAGVCSVTMSPQTFTYDEEKALSKNLFTDSDGYRFGGWLLGTTDSNKPSTSNCDFRDEQVVKNLTAEDNAVLTLSAIWINGESADIRYFLDGTELATTVFAPECYTYLPSDTVVLPKAEDYTVLQRTGYIFSGWNTQSDYSGSTITGWGVNGKSGEVKLYGKFIPITYKIQFYDGIGGTEPHEQIVTYDEETALDSCTFTRQGYNFAGWTLEGSSEITYHSGDSVFNLCSVQDAVYKLYAKWTPGQTTFTIQHYFQKTNGDTDLSTYELDGSKTQNNQIGTTGQNTNISSGLTVAGFTFQTVTNDIIAADGSTIVKVYYKRNTIIYTFNKYDNETWHDGTTNDSIVKTGLYGASFTPPVIDKPGHTFEGWEIDGEGTQIFNSSNPTFGTSNATYKAYWEEDGYTIKFYLNGGNIGGVTNSPMVHDYGISDGSITLPEDASSAVTDWKPGQTGFTFAGWYKNAASGNFTESNKVTYIDFTDPDNLDNYELYAKWTYTVTYDSKGGTEIESQTYVKGQNVTAPGTAPTKEGYDFEFWCTNSGATAQFNGFDSPSSSGNITLYAKWTVHNYNITFLPAGITYTGGSLTYNITTPGECPTIVDDTSDGVFGGWYLEDDFSGEPITEVSQDTVGELKNVNVYAYFTKTIYVKDGGSPSTTGLNGLNPTNAVDSVSTAVSKIVALNRGEFDWNIAIVGTVTGTQVIDNSSLTTSVAKSVTLTGYETGATLDGGKLTSGTNRSTLTIDTTYPITITKLIITGGRGTSRSGSYYGGGLYIARSNASVTLGDGVKIRGNCCDYGGGVYVCQNAKLYMVDTAEVGDSTKTISYTSQPNHSSNAYGDSWGCGNYSTTEGGGIYNDGYVCLGYSSYNGDGDSTNATKSLDGGGIFANWSTKGGGIYNTDNGIIAMDSGHIDCNSTHCKNNGGGGIYNNGYVYFRGGSINSNKGDSGAAAVFMDNQYAGFYMYGGDIKNNTAYNATSGGAIYMFQGNFGMRGGEISNNINGSNSASAAGVSCFGGSIELLGGTIQNNIDKDGNKVPGVYVSSGSLTIGGESVIGVGTTYAYIPYTADNQNYIYTTVPITVSEPIDSTYEYKIYWDGTLNSNTVILQGGSSTSYQQFSLKNSGWTIDPDTGKAN